MSLREMWSLFTFVEASSSLSDCLEELMLDIIKTVEEQCLCPSSTSDTLNTLAPCASGCKTCWKMFDAESAWVRILQVKLFLSRKLVDGSWSQRELPSVFIWERVLQDNKKTMSFGPDSNIWKAHTCITCFYVISTWKMYNEQNVINFQLLTHF